MNYRIIAPITAVVVVCSASLTALAQMSSGAAGSASPGRDPSASGTAPSGASVPALPLPSGGTTRDITAPGNGGVAGTGLGGLTGKSGGAGSGSSVKGPPGQGIQGQGGGGLGPTDGSTAGQGGVAGGGSKPAGDNAVAGAPLNR